MPAWNGLPSKLQRAGQVVFFGVSAVLSQQIITIYDIQNSILTSEGISLPVLDYPETHDHNAPVQGGLDLRLNVAATEMRSGGTSGAYRTWE